ncbi:transposase [Yoonia sp. MH D7]
MKALFTDEQIITMIKEQKFGEKTVDVCRRHEISSAMFYKNKSKYGGMEPSAARRLRALEDENGKLKKLLAEQMLDNAMLRDINSRNGDARGKAECCRPPVQDARCEPAAGL